MITQQNAKPAIFIDRDGTLIEEVDHLSTLDDLRIFPFTAEALELLRSSGFLIIIVTNQSGIGRGYFSEDSMHSIHSRINFELGTKIDGFYYCPHLPDAGCSCRKPNLGMIEAACQDFNIDLGRSWIVGDKRLDIETGFNAGIGTAMVLTGYGSTDVDSLAKKPAVVADNLLIAARMILDNTIIESVY